MKTISLIIALTFSMFSFCQEEDKEIHFYTNLNDHENDQLFHAEIKGDIPYAILGKVKGKNFLKLGRYTIESIKFSIHNIETTKTGNIVINDGPLNVESQDFYITKVAFEGFVSKNNSNDIGTDNNQSKEKNIAKFTIEIGIDSTLENSLFEEDLSIYDSAILDFNIIPSEKLNKNEKEKIIKFVNFGGHICKSRVTFDKLF
ncbi:hypothetical protein [Psychroserpens sp.]